jgi:sugar fermentation stimulation protein A
MNFTPPLRPGFLIKRYNRFLADIELEDGQKVTAHCPNTGRIFGLTDPGQKVFVSYKECEKRKYPYTWEIAQEKDVFVGVNTHTPNKLIYAALKEKKIQGLECYENIKSEAAIGGSRLDFYMEGLQGPAYMEVKNVHLNRGGVACFPDTVTDRGTKHMKELTHLAAQGMAVFMMYVVQRHDCHSFAVAGDIDPTYAHAFQEARGVTFLALSCQVSPLGITLDQSLSILSPLYES